MKKKFDIEKEFDIRIEFDVKKELFDFENEFDIENEPITNLSQITKSQITKLIGAIHFLQICDGFVLDIEFVFKIE